MASSLDWQEELDIDDSDILLQLECRSSHIPHLQLTPPSSILPSKRPSETQINPTIGILNRFKKHHRYNTQPNLSVPSDLPSLEPCSKSPSSPNGNKNRYANAEDVIGQLQLDDDTVGIVEPNGLDNFLSQQPQIQIPANQTSGPSNGVVSQRQRRSSHNPQGLDGESASVERRDRLDDFLSQQPRIQIPVNEIPHRSNRVVSQQQRRPSNNPQESNGEAASVEVRDSNIEKRTPRVIPGPAGSVQRALYRKTHQNGGFFSDERGSQDACCSRIEREDDGDFEENPWLCAMDYIRREIEGHEPKFCLKSTIGFIKMRGNMDRIPQVVGIIKMCTSNKFGGMLVTLKDPTGTIGGTIHHKVIGETEFGKDISVGAVILLQQVVVFSPTPWAHYLNITLNNVVKVFRKGSSPPQGYIGSSFSRMWRNLSTDRFMEAGKTASKSRNPSGHPFMGPTNAFMGRSQRAGFEQPNPHTINNDWEGTRATQQPDDREPAPTHRNVISVENNALRRPCPEQDPKAGVSLASQNAEVYCNKKASIAAMVDWNDQIELLMVDDPDMFT